MKRSKTAIESRLKTLAAVPNWHHLRSLPE